MGRPGRACCIPDRRGWNLAAPAFPRPYLLMGNDGRVGPKARTGRSRGAGRQGSGKGQARVPQPGLPERTSPRSPRLNQLVCGTDNGLPTGVHACLDQRPPSIRCLGGNRRARRTRIHSIATINCGANASCRAVREKGVVDRRKGLKRGTCRAGHCRRGFFGDGGAAGKPSRPEAPEGYVPVSRETKQPFHGTSSMGVTYSRRQRMRQVRTSLTRTGKRSAVPGLVPHGISWQERHQLGFPLGSPRPSGGVSRGLPPPVLHLGYALDEHQMSGRTISSKRLKNRVLNGQDRFRCFRKCSIGRRISLKGGALFRKMGESNFGVRKEPAGVFGEGSSDYIL